ncbi:MAG TPA: NADH-quinone oxidoreductase subunit NuoH [Polyangiaceae bacterium]|nr:NADH-quinone oxidoreductase subunit NuoH [Polyangiaceae bacterium]
MNALLHGAVYGAVIVTVLLTITALGLWFERKFAGRMQSRLGPTMVGPIGLLQPVADVLKLLQKEDIVPRDADRPLFDLAPLLSAMLALAVAAVVPFSPKAIASDLDVGVLWVLAIGGLTVIPTFMAGWASNNKFALLGGMRAIAQSVSYGVPLVLAALVPVILTGSLSVSGIALWQTHHHWIVVWPLVPGLPAFVLFFLAMLAESNRIPFDIPEAESELVAGVTTEYTGMKFTLFYMAEYVHTLVGSAVAAALFFGGWDGPFHPGLVWMVAKTLLLFVSVYWVRWSLLRLRSDQLLALCWKWLTPIGIALVLFAAAWVEFVPGEL